MTTSTRFIHTPKADSLLSKLTIHLPFSYLRIYKRSIGSPRTILDIGCGDGLLMKRLSQGENWNITGIDIFDSSLKKARRTKAYKKLIKGDVVIIAQELVRKNAKFDTVFCSQVIEHITKKEGLKLLGAMDKLANERSVVATPRGFMHQPEVFIKGNPYQYHKSGWSIEDFRECGYRVHGLGLKSSWSESGFSRGSNDIIVTLSVIVSYLMSPVVYLFPKLAAGVLCIKEIKNGR